MDPFRIVSSILVPLVIGVVLSVCATKRVTRKGTIISLAAAGLLGAGLACTLAYAYPALFSNPLSYQSWLEWTPFVAAPPIMLVMFLARSLTTLAVGITLGFLMTRPGKNGRQYSAVLLFVLGLSGAWAVQMPHVPVATETCTYIYRISDIDDDRDAWIVQSDQWVDFLNWNLTPHIGYESFGFDSANKMQDRMAGPVRKPAGKGVSVFVLVKQYKQGGKVVAQERTTVDGYKTSGELAQALRSVVLSRKKG